ncbi:MAG: ABC-F family ATP-binding cassette domain-containing protein [Acidimicrobiales bacterium]
MPLTATGVTVTHGPVVVLDRVDITISRGHRVGLIGPNGAGKTTLLRVLAGELQPDAGSVVASPRTLTAGYLVQDPGSDARAGETLRHLLARRTGVAAATHDLEASSTALASGTADAEAAYADALERYLSLGAADLDPRAAAVCAEVGLDPDRLDLPVVALSGGQRARAALAAILLSRFDVFLLDEPTNDLDFAGLAILERFVGSLEGGAVIVSHDRRFLDGVVTEVMELDDHTHRSKTFGGGWAAYLNAREVAARHAAEQWDRHQQARTDLVERMRTQQQWASVGVAKSKRRPRDNDKAQRDFFLNKTERLASKIRITEKRLERLDDDAVDKPWEPWRLQLSFGSAGRSGDVVARLDAAVVRRGEWQLGPVDLEIAWADRVAITGPNGAGKSTLLGALLGTVPLTSGDRYLGPGVVVGSLDQGRARFSGTLLDAFVAATRMTIAEARSLLAKFGLDAEDVSRQAATLSPGERTRATLATLAATSVNCLVLDEPTNHLDLPAIEQLESALDQYEGTLLLVTHDRALLDRVAVTRRVGVGPDGTATEIVQ